MMKGQTLVEVLLALVLAVVTMTAVVTAVIKSLSNAEFSRNQNLAQQYAQEGIDAIRNLRDSNYQKFVTDLVTSTTNHYCLGTLSAPVSTTDFTDISTCSTTPNVGSPAFLIRKVTLIQGGTCGSGVIQDTVDVSWIDGKCSGSTYCHTATVTSCLANYNQNSSL